MIRTRKLALWAVAFGLLSVLPIEAQRGGGRGGFGGGISPGQVFGLLAFDEKFNVTDEQLLALRGALKPLHVEQQEAMAEMFGGGDVDFQAMRETMREMQVEMRAKVMGALSETLDEEQIETLKTHMQEQQEQMRNRFGRGGGGGGPRGGGGGGGGGGDGGGF